MKRIVGMAALALLIGTSVRGDWPQFQNTNRDGISHETVKLADAWPEGGPKVVWTIEDKLGTGYGGPVVEGGKVYVLDRVNDQQDVLRCIDLAGGKEEWTYGYDAPADVRENPKAGKYKGNYNGSRNLPAVDAKNVYTLGPFGDVTCVSKETHQPVWTKNMMKEYDTPMGNWGICQSPFLYKDAVLVAPSSKKVGIVALEKSTGKEMWKSEALGDLCWTSPAVYTVDGMEQVVMLIGRGNPKLVGLDAATGRKLWSYKWECANPIASPTDCGQGRFFISGGYKAGCALLQVSRDGDGWKVEELFKNKDCGARAVKPIFYKDHIFANSCELGDDKVGNGLMCMDLQGKVTWKTSNDQFDENGSVLIADDKIYNLVSESGKLRLVAATPEKYIELASAQVTKGINIWAPMAISDGKLLVRNRRSLLCLDVSAGK